MSCIFWRTCLHFVPSLVSGPNTGLTWVYRVVVRFDLTRSLILTLHWQNWLHSLSIMSTMSLSSLNGERILFSVISFLASISFSSADFSAPDFDNDIGSEDDGGRDVVSGVSDIGGRDVGSGDVEGT